MSLPRHLRIGILDRRNYAGNTGGDHGIRARRRFAEMRAWLQGHIKRGAAGGLPGAPQRLGLGMGPAAGLGPAAADDHAVLDQHRAYGGVGPGPALPATSQRQRQLHESQVGGLRHLRFLRQLIFQNPEDHFRNKAGRTSSSDVSSPSTASKSLASRKLR